MANLALLTISPTGRPHPSPVTRPPPFNTEANTKCPVIHTAKTIRQKAKQTLAYVSIQEETFAVRRGHFNKQCVGAGVGSVTARLRRFQHHRHEKETLSVHFFSVNLDFNCFYNCFLLH